MWILTHLVALWIGAAVGFWLAAALIQARHADEAMHNMRRRQ